MTQQWSTIWHQAITQAPVDGQGIGQNKTVAFTVVSQVAGTQVRIRFSNRYGKEPYKIGAATICVANQRVAVRMGGNSSFEIPVGGSCLSDACELPVREGDSVEVRMYYTSVIIDCNMIEEGATVIKGDKTAQPSNLPVRMPWYMKLVKMYNMIPTIEAIEVLTDKPARTIVAFGDSITALSRWTKPLAARLAAAYPGEYALLNSGISGNCLLYEQAGSVGPMFGEMGTKRFARDVLEQPDLEAVIIALGVNDVSFLSEETAGQINLEEYVSAITSMVDELHRRGVRVTMQTITPRLGCSRIMGVFTQEMEALRLKLNEWIRGTDIFDYVVDAEAVVCEQKKDGLHFAKRLQQGDYLHPNAEGGKAMADAYDLAALTGRS